MGKINLSLGKKNNRSCEGCTKCCEGWLTANIHGEEMYPGKPCQFVEQGVGCKIYKDRPTEPCKNFVCMWRDTDDRIIPDEFKPSAVGIIVIVAEFDGIKYYSMVEAGNKPSPEILSWFITFGVSRALNLFWTVEGKPYWLGNHDFNEAMLRKIGMEQ